MRSIRLVLVALALSSATLFGQVQAPVTVLVSAARTATESSVAQANDGRGRGLLLVLDVTAASGTTPTLDVKLQAQDAVSGQWVDVPGAAFAQKTATGTAMLIVYPGMVETANTRVSYVAPKIWRAVSTIAGTTPSFTFSLAGYYLP